MSVEMLRGMVVRWIEINTSAIINNVAEVKTLLNPKVKLMAVVKGDAYGCGAVECADIAVQAGCDMLGVTTLEEALELRLGNIHVPILVFSPLLPNEARWFVRYDITPTIVHKESLISLFQASDVYDKKQPIHLKIETGMGRFGIGLGDLNEILALIKEMDSIQLEGLYTHFAKVTDKNFVEEQASKLTMAADLCLNQGFDRPILHACASAGFLKYPQYHFDMVRIGTLLYGQLPAGIEAGIRVKDPWKLKAKLLQIKEINIGESVGYGRDFIAKKPMKIALVPIGLADGFNLDPPLKPKTLLDLVKVVAKEVLKYFGKPLRSSGTIIMDGQILPIVGRVGMQITAVDVTAYNDVYPEKEIEIDIRRTSASARIARVFVQEGKIIDVRNIMGQGLREIFDYRGESS